MAFEWKNIFPWNWDEWDVWDDDDVAFDDYEDPSSFDDSLLDELGYDPSTGSVDDWLQSILPTEEMDWDNWIDWGEEDPRYTIDMNWGDYEDPSSFDNSLLAELGYDPNTGSVDDWLQSILPTTEVPDQMQEYIDYLTNAGLDPSAYLFSNASDTGETGIFGGKVGPWLRNLFLGSGGTGTGTGGTGGNKQGGIMGLLNSLLGGSGQTGGGLLGGGGLGTLASLWALNKARKEGSDPGAIIPMGQQAYGMDDVYGGPTPDYRVFNIQPALMPGVAYANVGKPEGMEHGGIKGGPGDVTPAWLEPGEFVMTKKATGNIGAKNLYKMMKDAEGMG